MEWDISIRERMYHKLAEELLFKILNNDIPIGSKLPANSLLIQDANTSQETLRKALHILTNQKIVVKTYRGYFVTDDMSIVYAARQRYVERITQAYRIALSKASYRAEIQLELLET